MNKIKVGIIGAGQRGKDVYASLIQHKFNDEVEVVAVADPRKEVRDFMKANHNIEEEFLVDTWEKLLSKEKFCDALLICTNDDMHYEPIKAALEKGYHILVEKPLTNKEEEVNKLEALAKKHCDRIFMVCHVLRYAPFFVEIKKLIDSKELGEVVSIQHNENIGYYHMAHSFVRGNWRNSKETSPLILAKSCHDLDILVFLTGSKCKKISSFGNLRHFKKECQPEGASHRCIDCKVEKNCPYSAKELYMNNIGSWPTNVMTYEQTKESVIEALRTSDYGICVYESDNDVVDNQVSIIEFKNGVTATFNLCAFTHAVSRTIKIMCTKGEIRAHMERNVIDVHDFKTDTVKTIEPIIDSEGHVGHGGGDEKLLKDFLELVKVGEVDEGTSEKSLALNALESHKMAFAAEEARVTGKVMLFD